MNRYIVIDLKEDTIYDTNDLKFLTNEDSFDRFGGSVTCPNKENLVNELKKIVAELEEYYDIEKDKDLLLKDLQDIVTIMTMNKDMFKEDFFFDMLDMLRQLAKDVRGGKYE